ncbi:MAG: hypothetical protein QF535_06525 [Anaerolineales bacterium]|jgi:hypothetical protein|nr:hypothetical protein [Anaerolineales bacterium]
MKLRDKILYMSFGAGLVVLGMVLNSCMVSNNADAHSFLSGLENGFFKDITCRNIYISHGGGISIHDEITNKVIGEFGVRNGSVELRIVDNDKEVSMGIDENGGRFDCLNSVGESVAFLGVVNDGGGAVVTKDKFGYKR